ncbi:hypothetical protein HRG_012589 [Hirsutella rhossiliensis]
MPLSAVRLRSSTQKSGPSHPPEAILQMAIKAINDTAGPNGIVPTLLVFGAYPRMALDSPPFCYDPEKGCRSPESDENASLISATRRRSLPPAAAAADDSDIPVSDPASDSVPVSAPAPAPVPAPNPPAPRKRGRPPGSKNKPKTTFLVKKEEDAYQLAIKLRDEGIITTPGTPL